MALIVTSSYYISRTDIVGTFFDTFKINIPQNVDRELNPKVAND